MPTTRSWSTTRPQPTAGCVPTGDTGKWWAATGESDGYEQWQVDLSRYAGHQVKVAISYASDFTFQEAGVFVDDVAVSTGEGTTSFEDDGDTLDGWKVPGSPARQRRERERLDRHHRRGARAARRGHPGLPRPAARDDPVHGVEVRSVPVLDRRRRGRRRGRRLRAGEPDPPGLLTGVLGVRRRRLRRGPRDRPPVVRRRRRRPAVAQHLAQRGLRQLRRVAVV